MVIGVIYKYTSPSGKVYIGQTTNELYRRRMWFGTGRYTGGRSKIDRARRKYGAENFSYEILFKAPFPSIEIATQELNKLETYYIGLYDSYKNGYNSTIGGDGSRGFRHSAESKLKISIHVKGIKKPEGFGSKISKARKGKPLSEDTKGKLSQSKINNGHQIAQYSLEGTYIRTWPNIGKVASFLKVSRESIAGCCRGKSVSAHNFLWRYIDGAVLPKVPPKGKRRGTKIVLKLNLDGHLLEEFDSVEDAANSVGAASTNISACCRGKVRTIKGYKWRYKNGNI